VGLRAGLDTEARGKILCPGRGSNPDRPVVQPVVRHYTGCANPAPTRFLTELKCSKSLSPKTVETFQKDPVSAVYTKAGVSKNAR
jgi:hypothetical protein